MRSSERKSDETGRVGRGGSPNSHMLFQPRLGSVRLPCDELGFEISRKPLQARSCNSVQRSACAWPMEPPACALCTPMDLPPPPPDGPEEPVWAPAAASNLVPTEVDSLEALARHRWQKLREPKPGQKCGWLWIGSPWLGLRPVSHGGGPCGGAAITPVIKSQTKSRGRHFTPARSAAAP